MSKYFEICPTSKTTVEDLELMNKYINTQFHIDTETCTISTIKKSTYEELPFFSYTSDTNDLIKICGLLYLGRLQKCCETDALIEGEL